MRSTTMQPPGRARGGASYAPAEGPTSGEPFVHVRVGIALDARLIAEERLGPGSVPSQGLSDALVLVQGRWHLVVGPHTTGRISIGGAPPRDAREFRGRGPIVVEWGTRARLELEGRSLLIEATPAPLSRLRPTLDASLTRGFFSQLDPAFTLVVLSSFVLHLAFVTALEQADWSLPRGVAGLTPEMVEMLVEPLREEPFAPTELSADDLADAADDTSAHPEPTLPIERPPAVPTRRSATADAAPDTASDAAAALAEALTTVDQLVVGARGPDGAFADVLSRGAAVADAASVLEMGDAVSVASADSTGLSDRSGRDTTRPTGDLAHLSVVGGSHGEHVEGETLAETGPVGRVIGGEIEDSFGIGSFDERVLMAAIRRATSRITRCYEHALGGDSSLAGRITVGLTVEETGTLSHVRVIDDGVGSEVVATCIARTLASIRVSPAPTGGTVAFRFPFVFASSTAD